MLKKVYAFIDLFQDPLYLAGLCLALCVVISTSGMALGWLNIMETYRLFPWMIAAAMLLYYSFYTGVALMVSQQTLHHWGRSIYGFGGYVLSSGAYAWILSGQSIYEAATYRSIYIVLTLAFFIFLGIGTSVKAIVAFTKRKDQQDAQKFKQDENLNS
jgi:hypothetical protein